ncbi:MAG TPA: efflux transporter periplasmic adaptor subunit, partial [Salinivirgaceae bacterium]|nr:efflux transporter periplasmic adaptor subunit [Salinivirgaceae bacterium]
MDRQIEKKKGIRKLLSRKGLPYLGAALLVIFIVWLILRDNSTSLRIETQTISIGEVKRGEFNDYVRVSGQVQPITSVQLSPLESGIVERLVV